MRRKTVENKEAKKQAKRGKTRGAAELRPATNQRAENKIGETSMHEKRTKQREKENQQEEQNDKKQQTQRRRKNPTKTETRKQKSREKEKSYCKDFVECGNCCYIR